MSGTPPPAELAPEPPMVPAPATGSGETFTPANALGIARDLLKVSRPGSWATTALPFLVAALDAHRGLTPAIVIGTLYFLGPYNLLLHGIADMFQSGRDVRGSGTGSPGSGLVPGRARRMQVAIAIADLPLLVILVLLAGAAAGLALALAIAAAIAYSAPPLRTRARPVLDSFTRAMHLVLPAVCGFLVGGLAIGALPWVILLALTAWGMSSHALGAIRDIAADRAAGIASIATVLGVRITASIALAGFVVAAAFTATLGPIGVLAALALDLYLLLPAMILLARRQDPEAEPAAARRALAGLPGLDVLVGLWLILLLLRHWEVTTSDPLGSLTAVGIALALVMLANIALTWLVTYRRGAGSDDIDDIPSLTVVVPSHDSAEWLAATLDALVEQTYADLTILVVDVGSTDDSIAMAEAHIGETGRVIVAPPKPDGWSGRSWACQVGAESAQTDLVLFVDADTYLVPVAVRILVEQFQRRRAALLSGITGYTMGSHMERAVIPGFALLLFGSMPVWWSALTNGRPWRLAFAYGPLLLADRATYLEVGGHGPSPAIGFADVDLARRFARQGRRVATVHAADLGETRHDTTLEGAIDAWRRIILPSSGGSLALAIATIVVEILVLVVPLVLPFAALAVGAEPRAIVASLIPVLLLAAARFALVWTQRQPLATILWHPVTVTIMVIGQLVGIVDHVTGRPDRRRDHDWPIPSGPASESAA